MQADTTGRETTKNKLFVVAVINLLGIAASGYASVTVENLTNQTVTIYLAGPRDQEYIGPYVIRRKCSSELPIDAGRYRVLARIPGGDWLDLGWQDYTNQKIRYSFTACVKCTSTRSQSTDRPVYVFTGEVLRPVEYVCPRCGQVHVRWEAQFPRQQLDR